MAVSALAVANALIRIARQEGRPLTNMQVQKHVFLAQGFCLGLLGRPIYYNDTHAWQWGPVVAKLYKPLQKYGSGIVSAEIPTDPADELDPSSEEYRILQAVWNAYKGYSGGQLSELTHREGTPWSKAWNSQKFSVIPQEWIQAYYEELVAAHK